MKFKPHEFFKKHPEIEEIAIRLEESEKEAQKRNEELEKKRASSTDPEEMTGKGKKKFQRYPECGVISHYCKDGRWEQTPYVPKPGRDIFIKDLAKILESRDPDAIKIEIYKGQSDKSKSKGAVYSKDIYLITNPEVKETPNELGCNPDFESSLEKIRGTVKPNNYEIELLRKDFDARLKEQEHAAQIRELKLQYDNKIKELDEAVKERNVIIDEMKEDLRSYEGELSGLKEEKEQPFSQMILSRVLTQAGENILRNNPKLMKIGLGVTDEEIKRIWESDTKKIESGTTQDNSGFSEGSSMGDLDKLDPKHAQGIKDLLQFFKQIKTEEFRKLYAIDCILQDPDSGMLNNELTDKVLQFINHTQSVSDKKEPTTATNEKN